MVWKKKRKKCWENSRMSCPLPRWCLWLSGIAAAWCWCTLNLVLMSINTSEMPSKAHISILQCIWRMWYYLRWRLLPQKTVLIYDNACPQTVQLIQTLLTCNVIWWSIDIYDNRVLISTFMRLFLDGHDEKWTGWHPDWWKNREDFVICCIFWGLEGMLQVWKDIRECVGPTSLVGSAKYRQTYITVDMSRYRKANVWL